MNKIKVSYGNFSFFQVPTFLGTWHKELSSVWFTIQRKWFLANDRRRGVQRLYFPKVTIRGGVYEWIQNECEGGFCSVLYVGILLFRINVIHQKQYVVYPSTFLAAGQATSPPSHRDTLLWKILLTTGAEHKTRECRIENGRFGGTQTDSITATSSSSVATSR